MGFDNECILNIQSLAGEYFCPVCRLLVYPNEALQSQCTHLYCKPCLTYVVGTTRACPYDGYLVTEADSKPLIESNKALAETIGKIVVHCLYHRSGCTWQGPLSECTSHCSGCAFGNSPVVCNRCGIQIVHRQVQEHAQNCPGVQPQAQQSQGGQDTATTGSAASADQSQTANLSGLPTSQSQTSQTTTVPPTGHEPNQQTSANAQAQAQAQAQAVAPAAVPTPEQWYQQQYQQYYQQYPGYDPYQQTYQHYYPYQQQAIQQYQQHPQHVQGQPQPQAQPQPPSQPHLQPQPQAQAQGQSQPQPQPPAQLQPQPQPQPQSQPQPQPQPQSQPQPHQHVQAPAPVQNQNKAQVNPQPQLHHAVQPSTQMQLQTQPPLHGHPYPQPQLQPQPYSQAQPQLQPYPQSQPHSIQPHPQQHMQMPQYQQPHSQMQHPQPQIQPQPQPHSQVHPQQHSHSQPQPQAQPPAQLQNQPHPHPQPHPPQPNQPPNPNAQLQTQHPPGHAVTGHHSYPQSHALQQMQLGASQQHPMHMHPHSGPLPPHPSQMHGQFPQQSAPMRPPQSHAPMPNQQQPVLVPSQGQAPSIPPAQQQPVLPHSQQPGHPIHHLPVMQPIQQPASHQYAQQQPIPGQTSGPVQSQLNQQGHFAQQQQLMQTQLRPQSQPHPVPQNSHAYQQSQQIAHGMQPHQSQNYMGRPMMPNHGAQFQQAPGGFAGAPQVRPMQLAANQPSANQINSLRTSNQLLSEPQIVQSGQTSKPAVFERQGDHMSAKSLIERGVESPSQKTAKTDTNSLVLTSSLGADSVVKSETDVKSMDDEQKPMGYDVNNTSQVDTLGKGTDSASYTAENGPGEPAIKPMVKKEGTDGMVEPSPDGKSTQIVAEEHKDAADGPKQMEQSFVDDVSMQKAEALEEQRGKLPKDVVDAGVPVSTGADKGSQGVPTSDNSIQKVVPQGNSQTPLVGRDPSHHVYLERNSSQSQHTHQVPGVDEYRGFPPNGQVQGKGFMHPAHPVPPTDQGRHQQPQMHYGTSTHQQRPGAPSMSVPPTGPPPGPPYHAQVPGQPPTVLRPQGPGHLPQPGQTLNPPEHLRPPVKQPYGSFHPEVPLDGISGPGPTSLFGRGPNHAGLPLQGSAPQGHYNQGLVPPQHAGLPRMSQGELPVGGAPQGVQPPGSFDSFGGIMGRAPAHGPEGHFGKQHPINLLETETFPNQKSRHFDGRQPESHLPGTLGMSPFGPPSGLESNTLRMGGAPGLDFSSARGLQDERFKPLTEGRINPFPLEPVRHLDRAPERLDKATVGINSDTGLKLDPSSGGAPTRFLPPYHPAGAFHSSDALERTHPVGPDDHIGRADISRAHPDFRGPGAGFGRHHMDRLTPRSPGREYTGISAPGFGGLSGISHNKSGLDDIDGREPRPFGEGSRSFNLPSDRPGNSFHENMFPILPSHLRRGEFDGPVGSRGGDLIGRDILPSHSRRGEFMGPRNLPAHLHLGEPGDFGVFPDPARIGELAGPGNLAHHLPLGDSLRGNKSSHPRLGEPGFRSSYSLQGFPNDGGFYTGGINSFDNSRKRKPMSMGWCRICKVDCETVEGLDLHSQTREHQKMSMDMVLSIKQQNAKKQRTSNDHSSFEEASKSRSAGYEGRGSRP